MSNLSVVFVIFITFPYISRHNTFHSVMPNFLDISIKGDVLGLRHKGVPALDRSRLQIFQHLRKSLDARASADNAKARWRFPTGKAGKTVARPSSSGFRPRAFTRPTMYVLVTTARNGLALVIYAPRGGTSGIFCDQIVRYINSDFFHSKKLGSS